MSYINLNGKITTADTAAVPVDNGAFRYGYGLFETMLVQDGHIRLAAYHWQRLFSGAAQLCFDVPVLLTADWLQDQVLATVKKNKLEKLCRVRLQLFAGGGGLYGRDSKPGFLIECFPLTADAPLLNENGLTIGIANGLSKSTDSLANLKSCNALIYAMAAKQAAANKWNDALICNTAGNIIESTIANLFWVRADVVYTPPLADGCIAGVMRRHIMERVSITEKSCTADELLQADEIFLTNAIKTIRWVNVLNDRSYRNTHVQKVFDLL